MFTAGSFHQAHERFSEVSRRRQCAFMSFSALLCAQSFTVQQWSTNTIDQILVEGDKMYLNALENGDIPDADVISLADLPVQARWPVTTANNANKTSQSPSFRAESSGKSPIFIANNQSPSFRVNNADPPVVVATKNTQKEHENQCWLINYEDIYQGNVNDVVNDNQAPYFTLRSALMNTFTHVSNAFIILEGYIMALI